MYLTWNILIIIMIIKLYLWILQGSIGSKFRDDNMLQLEIFCKSIQENAMSHHCNIWNLKLFNKEPLSIESYKSEFKYFNKTSIMLYTEEIYVLDAFCSVFLYQELIDSCVFILISTNHQVLHTYVNIYMYLFLFRI